MVNSSSGGTMTKITISNYTKSNGATRYRGRVLSVFVAILALIVFAPIITLIFLYLCILHRGSPIFAHERVGQNGKFFKCYKFQTMRPDAKKLLQIHIAENEEAAIEWQETHKLKNDPRIYGRFCEFLRKTGLDELPQILNILRGDMDVVGPRPVTSQELPRYGDNITHYYSVRPGLTGQWQVSGRNDISYEERVTLDVEYIKTATLYTDLTIIVKTAIQVVSRAGY